MTSLFRPLSHRFIFLLVVVVASMAASFAAAPGQKDLVARGKYLAMAGDCTSCHTADGGKLMSGGKVLATPFGSMTSPNITADKETGIGSWTDQEFYRAMHEGLGKHGEYLYPVFPYASYTKITRTDVLAIKAYLFSLPAVSAKRDSDTLEFPFSVRQSAGAWRTLFFKPGTFQPDPHQSAQVNRGAYLVEGLGHCGECHTPRNALGAQRKGASLQGTTVDGWFAPNITSDARAGIGSWSNDQLAQFLQTGTSTDKGVAIGPMSEVVHSSLQYLTQADIRAMAAYLKSTPPGPQNQSANVLPGPAPVGNGGAIYLAHCVSCHQLDGNGLKGSIPALSGNGAVLAAGANTVLAAVVGGVPASGDGPIMPAFAAELSDEEIAEVANYVRSTWANHAPTNADPHDVAALRKKIAAPFSSAAADCPAPADSDLSHMLSDPNSGIASIMAQVSDQNMWAQTRSILGKLKAAQPNAPLPEVVNALSTQYCSTLAQQKDLTDLQKRARYYRFGRIVYRQYGATSG